MALSVEVGTLTVTREGENVTCALQILVKDELGVTYRDVTQYKQVNRNDPQGKEKARAYFREQAQNLLRESTVDRQVEQAFADVRTLTP